MAEPTKSVSEIALDAIDGGVVVGIGIASGVLGILIGLLSFVACYCCRPTDDKKGLLRGLRRGLLGLYRIRDEEVLGGPEQKLGGEIVDDYLLDGPPDNIIACKLTTIVELINVHSQVHYHLEPKFTELEILTTALLHLGIGEGAAADLEKLMLQPSTRRLAIRNIVGWAIFYNLDIHSIEQFSLLPPATLEFLRSSAHKWNATGTTLQSRLALIIWRRLSAFLLHSNNQTKTPLQPSEDKSRIEIKTLVDALDELLKHFATADRERRRLEHLAEIIHEATKLGYILFSHPCEWAFTLDMSSLENEVMVVPGLERLSRYDGKLLDKAHRVVELKTVVPDEMLGMEGGLGSLTEE